MENSEDLHTFQNMAEALSLNLNYKLSFVIALSCL